jgi:ABC-2 type transport system permease protein
VRKTWIFLKLRLLQLRSDKTALFFCYGLPVLLLLFIGYPMQMNAKPAITLAYADLAGSEASAALLERLQGHALVRLQPYAEHEVPAAQALASNHLKHYLELRAGSAGGMAKGAVVADLYANSLSENQVENTAIRAIVDESLGALQAPAAQLREVHTDRYTSYLVTLLPGVIGMTLLIIGLNGFGAVLIEERQHGLYKNIKSIDASPLPFLAGLLVSRMLVAYSVAVPLLLIGVLFFGMPADVDYALLLLVVTLGCVAFLGMGLVLATISPSTTAFSGIVNAVQMPFIILGGVFFSVSAFPGWLQSVTQLMPLTQLNTAMRQLLFESVGFHNVAQISTEIGVLVAWCAFTLVFARLRFKW